MHEREEPRKLAHEVADATTAAAPAAWTVSTSAVPALTPLEELVMAWAKDSATGEPRYIFELGADRRGAKCGCECYSCGLPLTAVNAAKNEWKLRPHFRHPEGAERRACLVLTARAAALEMLRMEDKLVLPSRKVGVPVTGVSGKQYEAWVTRPAERVSIKSFLVRDQVTAVLKLEDGRELLVRLTGSLESTQTGGTLPVIQLVVDDPALAALSPEQLKSRLHLLVEGSSWCGAHWDDSAMAAAARSEAEALAAEALDWAPPEALAELGGAFSNETLLHWLAKDILRQAGRLQVPAVLFRERWGPAQSKNYQELARRVESVLQLSDVRLERKVGQIRPDVIAQYLDPVDGTSGVLLVEVTVTNEIAPERLARIRAEGHAALEINVGQLGGTLTKRDFTRLVTEELTVKRWLHHPWLVEKAVARKAQVEEQKRQFDIDVAGLKERYLAAFRHLAALRAEDLETPEARQARKDGREAVRKLGEEFALYGCTGADDDELFGWQGCILDRLLSIEGNSPVGYRLETLWQVVHTALNEKAPEKLAWHTLYLWALKAFPTQWKPPHQAHIDAWRRRVWDDLKQCERENRLSVYLRSRKFDPFLGLLFPEMHQYLEVPLPGEPTTSVHGKNGTAGTASRAESRQGADPRTSRGWWLEGADLAEWKRRNPGAAEVWEQGKTGR